MQCACAMMSSVACPTLQFFLTLSINSTIFGRKKNYWTQNVCFCLKFMSEIFLILRITQRDIIINVHVGRDVKYRLLLWDFNEIWIFSNQFSKKYSNIKFHENPPSESRFVPCAQTNIHDEADSHYPQRFKTQLQDVIKGKHIHIGKFPV